jgi:hypothetical protein
MNPHSPTPLEDIAAAIDRNTEVLDSIATILDHFAHRAEALDQTERRGTYSPAYHPPASLGGRR